MGMQSGNVVGQNFVFPILDLNPAIEQPVAEPCSSILPGDLPARFVTLGCKVNQYETQYVRELLHANGYRDARTDEPASLAVVNTCTVTAESDSKSRQLVRQLAKENPGVKIVIMGCYATRDPQAVRKLPGVAGVIEDKRDLENLLRPFGVQKAIRGVRNFDGHQRAFVKVQDGCILNCTFCIIPTVRPGLLSRKPDDIVDEIRQLVDHGYREVVLTGIHLGHYGVDLSQGLPKTQWQRLWHLLERLAKLPQQFRVRLSSLEATEVTEDFVRVLADYPDRICPHLHLSMQSGSDRTLQAMKRRYRIAGFLDRCEALRNRLDDPAFTTDIIVGFPGETDADFQETIAAVKRVGFCKTHIFPFSARQGTEAALRTDQIPPAIIQSRKRELADVAAGQAETYHQRLVGRTLEMLVESPDPKRPGMMRGTACRAAPLRLRALPALAKKLVPVVATRVVNGAIEVEPVPGIA